MTTLSVSHLTVNYQQVPALRNVSFTLAPAQVVGVIGPNGAGKSTLMKALLGLIPVVTGTLTYGDRPLSQQRQRVAYVPQRSHLDWTFPTTVWDVVLMGRVVSTGWLRQFSTASKRLAMAALERVGMADLRDRPIGQLSGGQQQRVFLARALVQQADLFLLDEPFTGVDQKTETLLFEVFHELAAAGKLVMVIHHDLGAVVKEFDRLILLNKELIATGDRRQVMTADNLLRAYGGLAHFGQAA
jgi:manganese/iron transport system ATP-binding protein